MRKKVNHRMRTWGRGDHQVRFRITDSNEGDTHNMTNNKRVMKERIRLLAEEYINPINDEFIECYIGNKLYICLTPEEIDTFQGWKKKGYHVRRGQEAITAINLYNGRKWKEYYFFSQSQVCR